MSVIQPAIAQLGCGHWGRNIARNFAAMGALRAVVDHDPQTAASIAAANGVEARSLDAVLADSSIDAVAIATPAATHAEVALRALEAGKHVFVEKPLALSPNDAAIVVEAAERADRILMIGHLLQYHPHFIALKNMVAEGELGGLRYVYSNRLSFGKIRTEENVLWSFAPHDFSMILALVGDEPEDVSSEGAAPLNGTIEDWCISHLRFPSGLRAHVHTSWLHPFKEHRLVVVGDRAMAVFEDSCADWNRRLAIYPHSVDLSGPVPLAEKGEPRFVEVPHAEPLLAECRHFAECVATGARPWTDGAEGMRVLSVLDRAEASLRLASARIEA